MPRMLRFRLRTLFAWTAACALAHRKGDAAKGSADHPLHTSDADDFDNPFEAASDAQNPYG